MDARQPQRRSSRQLPRPATPDSVLSGRATGATEQLRSSNDRLRSTAPSPFDTSSLPAESRRKTPGATPARRTASSDVSLSARAKRTARTAKDGLPSSSSGMPSPAHSTGPSQISTIASSSKGIEHGAGKRIRLNDNPTFDMLVIGCGGGPLESNLSAYLVKQRNKAWTEQCLALEAGSGMGAMQNILNDAPEALDDFGLQESTAQAAAGKMLDLIQAFVITHAHLDHISALVLAAGSAPRSKRIWGSPTTLSHMTDIFSGRVWPKLALSESDITPSFPNPPYIYATADVNTSAPFTPVDGIEVCAHAISHGTSLDGTVYDSTAVFVTSLEHDQGFLFFGDVESDAISRSPRNAAVWRKAARKIADEQLATIFLECSYGDDRPMPQLFGHLKPSHLIGELQVLADFLRELDHTEHRTKRRRRRDAHPNSPLSDLPLHGLTVCVIHVKDDIEHGVDLREVIRRELAELDKSAQLGCTFLVLEQGMRLEF
ncbi:uncharacterized protein L969DRAFT_311826 [Mixia osmundae IAM 14324]|uniref:3',5'-cyclic-nucleotide phosphodiesterase n=1 Tax=Mixia osmundae (strain CBS 9802 / IAM 14324 / JCM 22182 / KY 12970) TaxID=764103 RepID=G7DYE2_MIXOS|nr:uncharacterized protein L969DRAFT_311826 [Mixia osmundae IAM 14324]KEI41504.1 hypothetical protein L969DRAFT_311826 [Mixia osmundae IAM 14324]GAA95602.1 hypothetical protein E5Q_02258 [Mixia osmundae IAM 14324]